MEYTGERVIPEQMSPKNGMLLEHLARYEFALQYAYGRVIDIACGVGYGSKMLAEKSDVTEVVGVDSCNETISYAQNNYSHRQVTYYQGDVLDHRLVNKFATFDTVVSFETLEHAREENNYLSNIRKLAKLNGIIIISTPFGRGRGEPCKDPYHVHQLTRREFHQTIKSHFEKDEVTILHQRDSQIELPKNDTKYYLGVAVIKKLPSI